jgi:hypothetical protein
MSSELKRKMLYYQGFEQYEKLDCPAATSLLGACLLIFLSGHYVYLF